MTYHIYDLIVYCVGSGVTKMMLNLHLTKTTDMKLYCVNRREDLGNPEIINVLWFSNHELP